MYSIQIMVWIWGDYREGQGIALYDGHEEQLFFVWK